MPSPKRHSPRAVIREWLSHTNETDHHGRRKSAKSWEEKKEERARRTHPDAPVARPQPEAEVPLPRPEELHHHLRKDAKDRSTHVEDGRNVAEQLGLHAPFRSFATRGAELDHDSQPERHRHKRRRKSSSSFSYLEPAVHLRTSDEAAQDPKAAKFGERDHPWPQRNVDTASHASSTTVDSPIKPTKTYEKRSRHKTREDRYEIKKDKQRATTKEGENRPRAKAKKKRKAVEKSGAVLMQKFSANNVETDRLTLKATAPLGLFGKGRASSPVRRKGLPDLTFSEIDFLNHRKGYQEDDPRSKTKTKRRKEDRAADAEEAFSRFFAAPKDSNREAGGNIKLRTNEGGEQRGVEKMKGQEGLSHPPVELPEKPFLGFGSCGPGHLSPVILTRAVASVEYDRLSPRRGSSSNRSTTYFTWSRSSPGRQIISNQWLSSQRPPDGTQTEARPGHGVSADGHERPLSRISDHDSHVVSRTPPTRHNKQRRSIDDHATTCHKSLIPETVIGHAGMSRVEENDTEAKKSHQQPQENTENSTSQRSPQKRDALPTSTNLASLLAAQNRPELLGAVLDLLLGKVNLHDSKTMKAPKPPESANSRLKNNIPVPEAISEPRLADRTSDTRDPDPLPSNSDHVNRPVDTASPRQAPDFQWPQSSNTGNKARTHTATSYSQLSKCASERLETMEAPSMLQHDQDAFRFPEHRPDSSNAWTGYRNLYQGQLGGRKQRYDDLYPPAQFDPAAQESNEAPRSELIDPHHLTEMCEEEKSLDLSGNNVYSSDQAMDEPASTMPDTHEGMAATVARPQLGNFRVDENLHQELALEAVDPLFGHPEDFHTDQNPCFHEPTSQAFEQPAFLGGRGFKDLELQQRFSPWTPCKRLTRQDTLYNLSSPGDMANLESLDQAPLTGFWKPHRLY
ncbi:MAG: hypothetical protein L6R40_008139 [Gallowayella cf. fulva]|nr:MAG: hypothetical protein L6R40_008139 [Xanthomendoza cf. fulva]